MKVLVACEFSGTVRDAFLRAGHDAVSCDLLPTESPGPHIQGDVLPILAEPWDLVIAHPPCTYLTNSGVRWLYERPTRWCDLIDGAVFFRACMEANAPRVAVENPVMHGWARKIVGRGPDQVVQPWQFGHPESKATCLWLKHLPALVPTDDVRDVMKHLPASEKNRIHYTSPSPDRQKLRSIFYQGIADAMAEQWGAADPKQRARQSCHLGHPEAIEADG